MREYYKPTVNSNGDVDILIVNRKTWDSFDNLADAEEEVVMGNNRAYLLFPVFLGWACFGRILFGIGKLIYLFASGAMRIY